MLPEEVGALLGAAGVGWLRFAAGRVVAGNEVAEALALVARDASLAGWRETFAEDERALVDGAFAVLAGGAAAASVTVVRGAAAESGVPRTIRVTLRRSAEGVVDALMVDQSALAVAERDLAEAEELIALLPPHVFWEAADISRQRTIQSRLESMVAERTAELERQMAERERAEQAALAASRAKSEFLTNISHELRTPLNAVLGYGELILEELAAGAGDGEGASAVRADVERIVAAGGYLLELVDEILDLSKIEAGRMTLSEGDLALGPWLSGLVASFDGAARANKNTLVVRIDPGLGAIVVDDFKLRQIVGNLLSNACKFTKGGRVEVEALPRAAEGVEIVVRDSGVGIAAERLATLFEPFVQASVSRAWGFGGSGLGLVISRCYAEMMGGSLCAESTVGAGSCFRLALPRRRLGAGT